jgi:hypothetical protein
VSRRANKRHAARRDDNEPEIVEALRWAGALVDRIDGKGVPDLLVAHRGRIYLLEVKNPTYKWRLTTDEKAWHDAHADCDAVHIVTTVEGALAAVGASDGPRMWWMARKSSGPRLPRGRGWYERKRGALGRAA